MTTKLCHCVIFETRSGSGLSPLLILRRLSALRKVLGYPSHGGQDLFSLETIWNT